MLVGSVVGGPVPHAVVVTAVDYSVAAGCVEVRSAGAEAGWGGCGLASGGAAGCGGTREGRGARGCRAGTGWCDGTLATNGGLGRCDAGTLAGTASRVAFTLCLDSSASVTGGTESCGGGGVGASRCCSVDGLASGSASLTDSGGS